MGIFASSKAKGGAGGTTDTQARTEAANATAKLNKIYKTSGDSVDPGSEVFILLASGAVVNYKNPKDTALTVPDNATDTLLLAAGFTGIAAKEQHLHSILANANTLASSDTVFKVAGGKLWQNKVNNPVITLQPTDAAWPDNWVEFKPAAGSGSGLPDASALPDDSISIVKNKVWTTGLLPDFFNVASVAQAGSLKPGEYGKAEPPANTTYTFNPPAPAKDVWFGVINTGQGVVVVDNVAIAARGVAFWVTNQAGDAWVFISGDNEVPPHTHDRLTDGVTTFAVENGSFGRLVG